MYVELVVCKVKYKCDGILYVLLVCVNFNDNLKII